MTWRARLVSWFPAFMILLIVLLGSMLVVKPTLLALAVLVFMIYGLPVLCFRLHNVLWPLKEGMSRLDGSDYSPWWSAHQIQVIYDAIPLFETVLRLVPGLYSAWLRLWGSRVGTSVYWTPRVEIIDRSLMEIGDRVIFGDRVACYAHVASRKGERLLLYVRQIRIGNNVFIGAGSRLGPGAQIADHLTLPVLSDVGVDQRLDERTDP